MSGNLEPSLKIGIFYGSSTCYTDMVSERICRYIVDQSPDSIVHRHNITDSGIGLSSRYQFAIYGIPTWDYGELQDDWDDCWDQLMRLNLSGQWAAIYGLGDQIGYPKWFQDALGYLYYQLDECGAQLCGFWPVDEKPLLRAQCTNPPSTLKCGYDYQQSQALNPDKTLFLGLPLDEENQAHLTDIRLSIWISQVLAKFRGQASPNNIQPNSPQPRYRCD